MSDPNNLGYKVTSRDYSFLALAQNAWGAEFYAPDHGAYMFSNGRKFDSTDKYATGIYNGGIADLDILLISNPQYPDMAGAAILNDTLGRTLLED